MASKPKSDVTDPLIAEVLRRVQRAEQDRNRHLPRIRDCYKYTMPWRHLDNQVQPQDVLDEIFDSLPGTTLEDFAADMMNTFTPQNAPWTEIKPAETLDASASRMIEEALGEYQRVLFAEMTRSNLYQALQEGYMDLGIGTIALLIQDTHPGKPIHCQAIPAPDLLIDRGPYGFVSGMGRKWKLRAEDIPVLWPDAKPHDRSKSFKPGDQTEHEVIDWCWRDWQERGDEVWRYVVMVDQQDVLKDTHRGEGSHPFIVARWSRDPTTAWGMGPTYRTLPDIKTINHFAYTSLKNYDREADPVVSYEDDGVINVDHGVTPGTWIPRSVGSDAPEVVETRTRLDVQVFQLDERRSAIRRAHYQDRPEQKGKTPPTAHQWADEAAERMRRMGTPATNLVIELQYPIVRRFAYLLGRRNVLPKVELNGRQISLVPVSPLLRAQEQEAVLRLDRFAELIIGRFGPQMGNILIDGFAYSAEIAARMGIPPKVPRDKAQLDATIAQLAPLLGGAMGGGGGGTPPAAQ